MANKPIDDMTTDPSFARVLGLSTADISPTNRRRLSGPALRTFVKIASRWSLSPVEQAQVLRMAESDFLRKTLEAQLMRETELTTETLVRISAILGIYKALAMLLQNGRLDSNWLDAQCDEPWSGGRSAKEALKSGEIEVLLSMRLHLEQAC